MPCGALAVGNTVSIVIDGATGRRLGQHSFTRLSCIGLARRCCCGSGSFFQALFAVLVEAVLPLLLLLPVMLLLLLMVLLSRALSVTAVWQT